MKKIQKALLLFMFIFTFSLIVPNQAEAAVKISKKSVSLTVGETTTLKLKGTKKKVKWTSSKKSVATVNGKGKVTAKKNGTATITAKIGNKKYKCKVTVLTPKLSDSNLKLNIGDRKTLSVTGITQGIEWTTSNKYVAVVTSNGTVIAKGCGDCAIYAVINDEKLSCEVNVGVEDPICFPNKPLRIGIATIYSFEAKFVSFQIYKDYSKDIDYGNTTYFFPYKYHIKIKGSSAPNRKITIRFCMLTDGKFSDMPGNNFIQTATDSKGNFFVDQDINFSTYGEMIYCIC